MHWGVALHNIKSIFWVAIRRYYRVLWRKQQLLVLLDDMMLPFQHYSELITQGSYEKCKCNLRMHRAAELQYLTNVSLCKDLMQDTGTPHWRIIYRNQDCKVRLLGSDKQPIYKLKMTKRASLFRLKLLFVPESGKLNQKEREVSSGKGATLAWRQANVGLETGGLLLRYLLTVLSLRIISGYPVKKSLPGAVADYSYRPALTVPYSAAR